ncbi:IclR family transcriptional regulator [Arthrobacter sp. 9V]|uniref:IclR family transcriptional regulator n=1 Tax=Arthrobacter sp. 9V TaxID=2653132 RepID=UPI0012EFF09A|nr:IclR family transcriptional regulator [Arthrobacter sp. 9V]VXB65492.1 IclR family transcriptional regulator [Arthrobacter sp. 9V]
MQSVARAAHLLKALGRFSRPTSLSDLARRVELSKPATYNLLKTLEVEGLVSKDADARYQLSWGIYELGSAVVRSIELTKLSRFHLDRLATETNAAVLLGILDDDNVLYLDRGQTSSTFGMVANSGRRSSLHATASGKVLLANQAEDYVHGYISRGLKAYTSNTITDYETLREELGKIARRGYATCWEEREVGLSSLSVALRNYSGSVQASLTVAAPSNRLNTRNLSRFLVPLQREAEAISVKLGWTPHDGSDESGV